MKTIWIIILKILLCISICILCIGLFFWSKKKYKEGFQTTTATATSKITIATGLFRGISSASKFTSGTNIYSPATPNNGFTTPSSSVIAILLNLTATGPLTIEYVYKQPVDIYSSTDEYIATGYLSSYNHPNLTIHSNYVSGNYVDWGADTFTSGATYIIKANYCDIYNNIYDPVCFKPNVEPFPTILKEETRVEQVTYDNYILYNINTANTPRPTPIQQYDTASELSEYDTGAPIPWDYDNRMYDPQEILWGSIHPKCSESLFNSSYNLKTRDSINNITFNEETKEWTYPSALFNTTWSGDDEKFLPGIQMAEFIVQTGLGIGVEMAIERAKLHIIANNSWCVKNMIGIKALQEGKFVKQVAYDALIEAGSSTSSARAAASKLKAAYIKDYTFKMNNIPPEDVARIQQAHKFPSDTNWKGASAADRFERTTAAMAEQFDKADEAAALRATNKVNAADAKDLLKVTAKPAEAVASNSRVIAEAISQKTAGKIASIEMKSLSKAATAKLSKKAVSKIVSRSAGKMALKFGEALAMIAEGTGLLYLIAGAIGSSLTPYFGPAAVGVCLSIASALSTFLNIFSFACITFVPAILDAHIPADGVCPEGSFNIHEAIQRSSAIGELGWQILSNVPLIGDGLGTFGPYLCTKPDGSTVLKTSPLVPMYYYDSTLSIYAQVNKDAVSQNDARYGDRRKYVVRQGDKDPPIWVDFAEKTMLDKMAQFYYNMARMMATDNGDGTRSFQYITRFYGVTTSSEYSCDVQCEITEVTYYISSGIEQQRTIVPVDLSYGNTHHDRRFYFYPVQVDMDPNSSSPANVSARNVEAYYSSKGIVFLSAAERRLALNNDSSIKQMLGSTSSLDRLMIDNMNRYIVTACTHEDGTGVNAQEVDGEGDYVGDALVSLGDTSSPYNPPELKINSPMQFEMQAVITDAINISGTGPTIFTYINPLKTFIPPGSYGGESHNADKLIGMVINPNSSSALIQRTDGSWTFSGVDSGGTIPTTSTYFEGEVSSYSDGTPQKVGITNITWKSGTNPGTSRFVLIVGTRSNRASPADSPPQCRAYRGRMYQSESIQINGTPRNITPIPSYSIWDRSIEKDVWPVASNQNHNIGYAGTTALKIWNERKVGQMKSQTQINGEILQGTIINTISYRVMINKINKTPTAFPIPIGAFFVQSILGMNYTPGSQSGLDLIACTYSNSTSAIGTYIRNGQIQTLDVGDYTENNYRIVDRGVTIYFAPGYSCDAAINKKLLEFTQTDCVNRNSVRYAVSLFNTKYPANYVAKLHSIETDKQNKKCLYVFEAVDTSISANVIEYQYNDAITPVYLPKATIKSYPFNDDGVAPTLASEDFKMSLGPTHILPAGVTDSFNVIKSLPVGSKLAPVDLSSLSPVEQGLANITRKGSTDGKIYTCASSNIYNRFVTQFNLKYGLTPNITNVRGSYYPATGSIVGDGTIKCIYETQVKFTEANNINTSSATSDNYYLTFIAVPARDPQGALYDLVSDNFASAYVYKAIPETGKWIAIPPPLPPATSILRTGCTSISTCADPDIIGRLVNQFNIKYTDGKIMKVRKAYTPLLTGSNVCDYEVEMMRTIPEVNTRKTLVQKESIRLNMKHSLTDSCLWDLDMPGGNLPNPDTGLSLTNSAAVDMLDPPYVWAPSFLSNIRNTINDSILDYTNLNIPNLLSNITNRVRYKVQDVYNTVASEQTLFHPLSSTNSNCKPKCKDTNILQTIIDRYYADNYPASQHGAVKRQMVEIRRAGTLNSNICQLEFIERIDTYDNFILPPIRVRDPTDPRAKFNTAYYLRQYDFQVDYPVNDSCEFVFKSIAALALSNDFTSIDTAGNAAAIMSDYSALTEGDNFKLNFNGKQIDCADRSNMAKVVFLYDSSIGKIGTLTKAFNQRANVCEYYAPNVSLQREGTTIIVDRVIEARFADYNSSNVLAVRDVGSLDSSITQEIEYGDYVFKDKDTGAIVTPPYLYDILNRPSMAYDTTRVVPVTYP